MPKQPIPSTLTPEDLLLEPDNWPGPHQPLFVVIGGRVVPRPL